MELAPGVIEALGSIDVGSVRELQTALNRLIAHQNADGQGTPIDPDTVRMLFPARASGLTSGPDLESEPEAGFLDDPPFGDDVAPASEEESKPSEFFSFLSDVAHAVARHVGDPQTGEAADEAEVAPAAMGDAQREAPPAWLEDPAAVDDDRVPAAVNLVAHEGEPVADAYFLDDEKVLWDWPEIAGRVIEEPTLMAIRGSLREASLPDVLQLLAMGKKTGCLSVSYRSNFGYIYFDGGRISYASIVNRRDRLGDLLVKVGLISREQLDEAIAAAGHGPRPPTRRHSGGPPIREPRSAARAGAHADRRGRVSPVHLVSGDVQLRARHPTR